MRHRVKKQLKRVSYNLRKEAHDLFFNRKFNLHTLNQVAIEEDIHDLNELYQYLVSHDQYKDHRREELKQICIKFGINNPFLGEE
jgi:hypothetical protein